MIPDDKAFMAMLKNKEQVVEMILKDLDSCGKNQAAFENLERLYEEGKPVDALKAMKAFAKAQRHANDVNRRLLMICMVYLSGNNYDSDTAHTLNKLGKGTEALQEMMRRKMGGV